MKELSIEEKAKAYDKALVIAKSRYSTENEESVRICLELMFPELKKNEDEKIRKELISFITDRKNWFPKEETKASWIAWLEKQGEHFNFRNKIQIGDKVTRNEDGVLVNLSQLNRVAKKDEKQGEQKPTDKVEPKFHDGDVLCYEDEVFILKNYVLFHKIVYHCCYDCKNFILHSIYSLTKNDFNKIHPATKEQCNVLFQKMKEAGYEWDAEKKELKKIEQKHVWSEEDEKMLTGIIDEIEANKSNAPDYDRPTYDKFLNWLKSLKDIYTWKPSDGQMIVLNDIIINGHLSNVNERILKGLQEQLKKLMEK